jgi:hypothetical protein
MITTSDLCALVCRLCIAAPCVDSLWTVCVDSLYSILERLTDRVVKTVHTDGHNTQVGLSGSREPGHSPRAPARFRYFSSAG